MVNGSNIYSLGVPEREEGGNGTQTVSEEITARNFVEVMKDMKLWAQETP